MKGHDLYSDNLALLYRHFGEYRTKSQYFMTPLPFEVRYELSTGRRKQLMVLRPVKSPIPLGALFLCWDNSPELFRVSTPSGDAMIFSFNGSPLSGANCWSAVNLETGEIIQGDNAPKFMDRCRCLDSAVRTAGGMLDEMCSRKGIDRKEFKPSTLEETVRFVQSLER